MLRNTCQLRNKSTIYRHKVDVSVKLQVSVRRTKIFQALGASCLFCNHSCAKADVIKTSPVVRCQRVVFYMYLLSFKNGLTKLRIILIVMFPIFE